ncbi:MAG TPA: heme o synthase [Gallionellaceae bacterium]|nr:heme o synthase [Gallionellaceae bacterium]
MDHVQPGLQPALRSGAAPRDYFQVIKPGIVAGNLLSAAAGFVLASGSQPDWRLLAATLAGVALVIASACVVNNVLDRDLDRMMARTRARALAAGTMRPRAAVLYAAALGIAGGAILLARDNLLAFALVLGGYAVYTGLYTVILKRRSPWATAVGSLAGAAPPLAGYCAANGGLDAGAAWLALAFCLWQIAHFHAIAIRRLADYRAASIPVWPLSRGVGAARLQMLGCIIGYIAATQMLAVAGPLGAGRAGAGLGWAGYCAVTAGAGLGWLYAVWRGGGRGQERDGYAGTGGEVRWAKRAFLGSLAALAALSLAIMAGALLPPLR